MPTTNTMNVGFELLQFIRAGIHPLAGKSCDEAKCLNHRYKLYNLMRIIQSDYAIFKRMREKTLVFEVTAAFFLPSSTVCPRKNLMIQKSEFANAHIMKWRNSIVPWCLEKLTHAGLRLWKKLMVGLIVCDIAFWLWCCGKVWGQHSNRHTCWRLFRSGWNNGRGGEWSLKQAAG